MKKANTADHSQIDSVVQQALRWLSEHYKFSVKLCASLVDGPSISCRDEALLRGGRERHSKVGIIKRNKHPEQTLGIVHFRSVLESELAWGFGMAEAFLRPPGYWHSEDKIPLLSKNYPRLLGHENEIQCVPYTAQSRISGACTTACMYMCSLALCLPDRGAAPVEGPFSLSCISQVVANSSHVPEIIRNAILTDSDYERGRASFRPRTVSESHLPHAHDSWQLEAERLRIFGIGGLPFAALPYMFPLIKPAGRKNNASSRGIPAVLYRSSSETTSLQEFSCALYSYLSSRLPIILRVDEALLNNPGLYPRRPLPDECLHAICVIGSDDLLKTGSDSRVCFHDPKTAPYMELNIEELFEAAKTRLNLLDDPKYRNEYNIEMVVPIPQYATFDVQQVMQCYRKLVAQNDICADLGLAEPTLWRIRLLRSDQALNVYYYPSSIVEGARQESPSDRLRQCMKSELQWRGHVLCLEIYCSDEAAQGHKPNAVLFLDPIGEQSARFVGALILKHAAAKGRYHLSFYHIDEMAECNCDFKLMAEVQARCGECGALSISAL